MRMEERIAEYKRADLTDFERKIFNEVLINNKKITIFSSENGVSKSTVYYTIKKIREKLLIDENKSWLSAIIVIK